MEATMAVVPTAAQDPRTGAGLSGTAGVLPYAGAAARKRPHAKDHGVPRPDGAAAYALCFSLDTADALRPPLGLKLAKTPALLALAQETLGCTPLVLGPAQGPRSYRPLAAEQPWARANDDPMAADPTPPHPAAPPALPPPRGRPGPAARARLAAISLPAPPPPPAAQDAPPLDFSRLKAASVPARSLSVGGWDWVSKHEGDTVVKCYYAKRKLVWELLDHGLKSKIEVPWADVASLRITLAQGAPGMLEVTPRPGAPPALFRERDPQPRKHVVWAAVHDFTGGEAPACAAHVITFPPGQLDRHYERLVGCDAGLRAVATVLIDGVACLPPLLAVTDTDSAGPTIVKPSRRPRGRAGRPTGRRPRAVAPPPPTFGEVPFYGLDDDVEGLESLGGLEQSLDHGLDHRLESLGGSLGDALAGPFGAIAVGGDRGGVAPSPAKRRRASLERSGRRGGLGAAMDTPLGLAPPAGGALFFARADAPGALSGGLVFGGGGVASPWTQGLELLGGAGYEIVPVPWTRQTDAAEDGGGL